MKFNKILSKEAYEVLGKESNPDNISETLDTMLNSFCNHMHIQSDSLSVQDLLAIYAYINKDGNVLPTALSQYMQLHMIDEVQIKTDICQKYFLNFNLVTFEQCAYLLAVMIGMRDNDLRDEYYPDRYKEFVDTLLIEADPAIFVYLLESGDKYVGLQELTRFFRDKGTSFEAMIANHSIDKALQIYAEYQFDHDKVNVGRPDQRFVNSYFSEEFKFWRDAAKRVLYDKLVMCDDDNIYAGCYKVMRKADCYCQFEANTQYNFNVTEILRTECDDRIVAYRCERMRRLLGLIPKFDSDMLLYCTYWYVIGDYDIKNPKYRTYVEMGV